MAIVRKIADLQATPGAHSPCSNEKNLILQLTKDELELIQMMLRDEIEVATDWLPYTGRVHYPTWMTSQEVITGAGGSRYRPGGYPGSFQGWVVLSKEEGYPEYINASFWDGGFYHVLSRDAGGGHLKVVGCSKFKL